jgi:hypothetical protein
MKIHPQPRTAPQIRAEIRASLLSQRRFAPDMMRCAGL